MAQHVVTMLPGEGTGPEICEAVRLVIDASGVDIKWEYEEIGLGCLEKYGTLLPDKTIENIAKNKVAQGAHDHADRNGAQKRERDAPQGVRFVRQRSTGEVDSGVETPVGQD